MWECVCVVCGERRIDLIGESQENLGGMSDMKSGGTIGLTTYPPKDQVHLLEWDKTCVLKAMKDNKCNQK